MTIVEFSVMVGVSSFLAGFLGALTGLGGGVVVVPILVLGCGVDIHYAAGASLISVISTSSGAAVAYLKQGFSNIRIGMFLEIATTLGALVGASLATRLNASVIAVVFGLVLFVSAYLSYQKGDDPVAAQVADPLANLLKLNGSYPTPAGNVDYKVTRVPAGFLVMLFAGGISGLLGIGSGAMKVLAMDQVMSIPFKVSTTTSNFMIGVTAAASVGVYFKRGYVDPGLAMPVMLGVLMGSVLGARVLTKTEPRRLRLVFVIALLLIAVEMIYKGVRGGI